jgi:hypothetical protein
LQSRFDRLTMSHLQATQVLAGGIHAVPDASPAFNTTIAAHRFLNNSRVSLQAMGQLLLDAARLEAERGCDRYVLALHDWSLLMYPKHTSKKDRISLRSNGHKPDGYELQTALLASDRHGLPLAPGVLSLRAADGVHCSRSAKVRPPKSPLDELEPTMAYLEKQNFARPLVHIIDAEADSVGHYRQWSSQPGRYYLVRADDRLVEYEGQEQRCSVFQATLREQGRFRHSRRVRYHGQKAAQWVAEIPVRLLRAAQRNRPAAGDRSRIAGSPLELRLVISEVRDADGQVLAVWYLLTNLPAEVDAATIALWYYWRWSIETYFKLLKTAGMNVESWRQEKASAIARRLMVASMACVTVWRLARSTHPLAEPAREQLVRFSGRQMKHGRKFTLPALLAGLWTLLAMLEFLETHSVEEAYQLAEFCLPNYRAHAP